MLHNKLSSNITSQSKTKTSKVSVYGLTKPIPLTVKQAVSKTFKDSSTYCHKPTPWQDLAIGSTTPSTSLLSTCCVNDRESTGTSILQDANWWSLRRKESLTLFGLNLATKACAYFNIDQPLINCPPKKNERKWKERQQALTTYSQDAAKIAVIIFPQTFPVQQISTAGGTY